MKYVILTMKMFNLEQYIAHNSIVLSIKNLILINLRLYAEKSNLKIIVKFTFLSFLCQYHILKENQSKNNIVLINTRTCALKHAHGKQRFFYNRICYPDEIDQLSSKFLQNTYMQSNN